MLKSNRALIPGGGGQLGLELQRTAPPGWDVYAPNSHQLDVSSGPEVERAVDAYEPTVIINAAAFTAVDLAESRPAAAFAVNSEGPANLALAAKSNGIRLIHVSTDFVFDGNHDRPYSPADTPHPLNVYGHSKLQGELRSMELGPPDTAIVRTAWVHSSKGKNFVLTILRLLSEGRELRVVADQVGSPTWAHSLARILWECADRRDVGGVLHWTDRGVATWYDFAVAAQEEAAKQGLLKTIKKIEAIRTEDYPTAAARPRYSALDSTATVKALGVTQIDWRESLASMVTELARRNND